MVKRFYTIYSMLGDMYNEKIIKRNFELICKTKAR